MNSSTNRKYQAAFLSNGSILHLPKSYKGKMDQQERSQVIDDIREFIKFHEFSDFNDLNDELEAIDAARIPASWIDDIAPILEVQRLSNKNSIYNKLKEKEKETMKTENTEFITKKQLEEFGTTLVAQILSVINKPEPQHQEKPIEAKKAVMPTLKSIQKSSEKPSLPELNSVFAYAIFGYVSGHNQYKKSWQMTGIRGIENKTSVVFKSIPENVMKLPSVEKTFHALHATIEREEVKKGINSYVNYHVTVPTSHWYPACELMNNKFGTEFYIPVPEDE